MTLIAVSTTDERNFHLQNPFSSVESAHAGDLQTQLFLSIQDNDVSGLFPISQDEPERWWEIVANALSSTVNAGVFNWGCMSSNGVADYGDDDAAGGRPPRQFVPVSQRERLLDGMAQTVAQQGYAATSVADVLRAARISRRTFYEQFADKEDCFLAAYDQIADRCTELMTEAFHTTPSWTEGIERAVDVALRLLAAEPAFARLGVVEVLGAGPRGLARRDATLRRFVEFVERGRTEIDGAGAPPPDLVAQAIVGGIYELVYSHIVRGDTDRLPELSDELLHYTFMLLGTERPAPRRDGRGGRGNDDPL